MPEQESNDRPAIRPELLEAIERADAAWAKVGTTPLTVRQHEAVVLFGRVSPRPERLTSRQVR